ncbi:MAG: endolytic transglycosylase MltG [Clostridia bacterium]|nr:endolytic transglycosylase MltG [Clostridia bacterium]
MAEQQERSERRRLDDRPGQIPVPQPVPEPEEQKKRSSSWGFFRPIVIAVIALAIVGGAAFYLYRDVRERYLEPVEPGSLAGVEVTIPKGSSLSDISEILYENNLIRNKQVFKFYTDFTDNASKLKAGTYTLTKGMDFDDIIYTLRQSTDAAPTAKVTLPEGLTINAFGTILSDNGVIDGSGGYQEVCVTGKGVTLPAALLDPDLDTSGRAYLLEGYLFPDTYEFYTSSDPAEVVRRQLARFDEIFTEDLQQRAAELHMTQDEVITLASIIEKEAKTEQFAQVSAVFHNRLAEDMPLQSDATVSYGLGITNRINLTSDELQAENPYNTHVRTGLPAGPICNPGRAAIVAALYPDEDFLDEGYLYFTLTDPEEGTLAFSRTFEEHEALVEQWRPAWTAWDAENAQ